MSFFSRLFVKVDSCSFLNESLAVTVFLSQKEEDYETILSNLANDIKKRQVKLSEIRLRERRATLLVTLYTLATWVAYVSLWYMQYLPQIRNSRGVRSMGLERALKAFPVLIGPIVCVIRKISGALSVAHRHRHLAFCSFGGSFKFGINEKETQKVRFMTLYYYRGAHVGFRENGSTANERAEDQGRGDQEENQLLFHTRSSSTL